MNCASPLASLPLATSTSLNGQVEQERLGMCARACAPVPNRVKHRSFAPSQVLQRYPRWPPRCAGE